MMRWKAPVVADGRDRGLRPEAVVLLGHAVVRACLAHHSDAGDDGDASDGRGCDRRARQSVGPT